MDKATKNIWSYMPSRMDNEPGKYIIFGCDGCPIASIQFNPLSDCEKLLDIITTIVPVMWAARSKNEEV